MWGITNFDVIEISKKESEFTELEVWLGKKRKVKVYTKNDIYKTIPKARKKYLKVIIDYNRPVKAPIKKDDILGKLKEARIGVELWRYLLYITILLLLIEMIVSNAKKQR